MHSNIGVWRCKLFSMALMGWPVNTSKSLSLSYKCSRLFAFLWHVFIHLLSPSLPTGNAVQQQAGPEEDSLQNHKVEVTGLRFLLLSFGNTGWVERDSLSVEHPRVQTLLNAFRRKAGEQRCLPGSELTAKHLFALPCTADKPPLHSQPYLMLKKEL